MLNPYRKQMVIIMGLALIIAGISGTTPFISRNMIDYGLLQGNIFIVMQRVLLLALIQVFGQFVEYLQRTQEINITNDLGKKLKVDAFEHGLKLKPHYFKDEGFFKTIGDALYDISSIMMIANNSLLTIFVILCKCMGALAGLIILDWRLAIFVITLMPIKLWVNLAMEKRIENNSRQLMVDNKSYNSWLSSILTGVVDIKLWNLEAKIKSECEGHIKTINESSKKLSLTEAKNQFLTLGWEFAWMQGMYILGAFLIFGEQLTFGGLIAFVSFANYVLSPINVILTLKLILKQISPSVEGLKKFYEMEEENYAAKLSLTDEISNIEFKDVSLSFAGRNILGNLNLKIERGEKVAIVGDNGSGKTSIVNMLLRLQEPSMGEILINGVPISSFNIAEYREKISVVSQDIHLFKGTVYENITLGCDVQIDKDKLRFCTEAIEALENQFETQVGNDGAKLSGGERKKIALLRAFSRKSSILVLDEPTSNYDKGSEESFSKLICENSDYAFYFVITHRRDSLDYADKIITIEDGFATITST